MSQYITTPLQKRSREAADRVLQALDTLLKKEKWEHISMQKLANEAAVSMGSVYARFSDKQCILLELHQRKTDALIEEMNRISADIQEMDQEALYPIIVFFLAELVKFARQHQHIYRAVIFLDNHDIFSRLRYMIDAAASLSYQFLSQREDVAHVVNLEQRVDYILRIASATLQQTWIMKDEWLMCSDNDQVLVEELGLMIHQYLISQ